MQNVTEQDVIDYARDRHHIPSTFAKNWFQYWSSRNWITTNGKAILNWHVKFDWWVLDHKDQLILTVAPPPPPSPAEIRSYELQRLHAERERDERIYEAEQSNPAIVAEIEAIQQRLFHRFCHH